MFLSSGCSLLRAGGFFCSLDVIYEGLGIGTSILQFLIKHFLLFFSCKFFSLQFLVTKPWLGSESVFRLKCWIRIRIRIHSTGKMAT